MNTIRFRLTALIFVALIATTILGFLAYDAQQSYARFSRQIELSFRIYDYADIHIEKSHSSKAGKNLQIYRANLDGKNRQKALSNFIKAYNEGNRPLMRQRLRFFAKNEEKFREYAEPKQAYSRKRFVFYALLAVMTVFSSLIYILLYLAKAVFYPIKDLNRKMVDFLNHKYTYRFSVPAHNEIGNLQGTFNSLAQQVLTNIDDLKALDTAKSEFLSIASHELRTPLTSIKGSLSLLNEGVGGELNEPTKNLINIAEGETDRLIRLINDILDLAKIEAGKFPMKKEWYDLDSLVKKTLQGLEGLSQAAGVKLVKNDCSPIQVMIDSDRVQQVLTNLLSNAIKYSPKKGEVKVICSTNEHQHLYIEVVDQGKGIAPEDQALIFEQFRQATSPQNPLVKGTGLGLAIAKAIVEEHGGEIGVNSKPEEGSTFYFTLAKWKLMNSENTADESSSDFTEDVA